MTTRLDPRVLDVAQFAMPAASRAKGVAEGLPAAVRDAAVAAYGPGATASNVIKPKGGNWLAGGVENRVGELKRKTAGGSDPADALRGMRETYPPETTDPALLERQRPIMDRLGHDVALNQWIEKQLSRYVKNEMGTPEDPIRALADRGVSHVSGDPELNDLLNENYNISSVQKRRADAGFPPEGLAQTELGKGWEGLADSVIGSRTAGEYVADPQFSVYGGFPLQASTRGIAQSHIDALTNLAKTEPGIAENLRKFPLSIVETGEVQKNPWLTKVDKNTPVYDYMGANNLLGFEHLVDELRNATNPASGLPRELLLKPESLGKLSVPQAVERVAKINEWRAAQKAEGDLARAMNPATKLHKEYPEGYSWYELKSPDAPPKGWTVDDTNWIDPQGGVWGDLTYKTKALEDALKYEGEQMGHCVGGYCPDVSEGRSRIYSLRDKKGRPHVTIEVGGPDDTSPFNRLPDALQLELHNRAHKLHPEIEGGGWPLDFNESNYEKTIYKLMEEPKYQEALQQSNPIALNIRQIKGKQNRAPSPEYLPYVQDFVRSGKWGEIGDSRNAGLRRYGDVFNVNEQRAIEATGEVVPEHEWLTGEDIQRLHNIITPEGKRLKYDASGNIIGGDSDSGMKRGGAVKKRCCDVSQDAMQIAVMNKRLKGK